MYGRLSALPEQALPLQRAQLLAALSVGSEIIQLRRIAPRLGLGSELDAALAALAHGNSAVAIARLARLDHRLAARPGAEPETQLALRARSQHPCNLRSAYPACRLLRRGSARVRFTEIDLFGVYVAPISLLMVAAWLVTIALRRVAARFGLLRHVWHPALFVFAVYMIVLSSMTLVAAR